jgi:hypothetical protein
MRASLALFLLALGSVLGCTGAEDSECFCFACDPSGVVRLTVVDGPTGAPVSTFRVDVSFHGAALGEPPACTSEARAGENACAFGERGGLYHVVVVAPGYAPREVLVRQPEPPGDVCCNQPVCLQQRAVTVALDPLSAP